MRCSYPVISARALNRAEGGNIDIDARFLIAYPSQPAIDGNDILASGQGGRGGNIIIDAQSIFGLEERLATPGNGTNDIDASGEFAFGSIRPVLATEIERPINLIESEQTTAQACQSDRLVGKASGLTVKGKGGIPPAPDLPLNAETISINGEATNATSPQPSNVISTSQGDIIPAQGVEMTEDGRVILTAYRTDNNQRTPDISANCSSKQKN